MAKRPPGKLRIIGGEWGSRIVEFDGDSGARPTPDRVRQTVFDWLAPTIQGTRCLDLFAGSGAMGMEALSRGAAHCTFVENGNRQATLIKAALLHFKAPSTRWDVTGMDAVYFLDQSWHRYHVVFLDPPYASPLLDRALQELPRVLVQDQNRIYLEWPDGKPPVLPPGYELLKEKQAGQVCFGLARYQHPPK
ncbi:16S rRNA (guanine(966)-N(2))-methyltransferase RsmD [Solimonas sp. K1W22B-7]|uniref:16S rRNA (guanine(966)-N(2))-methyltransferase RsmD n=1 Tax=Solimonas sp. K1W22B-7 TaxID=2303331 RepID=UPI000E33017E|nr:16S rRNA (guanine(966)-N(2))-methyltransferase RsmD [Solimonas sp. K1W22B-7]AXQ28269.1 16S rRNA (guanine(966)-N(2))-methyltransferase RsmD [Solimonas sp. K1W22B-7]